MSDVRTTTASGAAASTRASASAFDRPYSLSGDTGSSSRYGRPARPSNTTSDETWTSRAPGADHGAGDGLTSVDVHRPRGHAVAHIGRVDDGIGLRAATVAATAT